MSNCNHNHGHEHDHHHHADQGHHCGGGCCGSKEEDASSGGGCCFTKKNAPLELSKEELTFLLELSQVAYLPLAQFVMTNSENDAIGFIAMPAVYLKTPEDSLEAVKERSKTLRALEQKGLISLDYEVPLEGYDYKEYLESATYAYFEETVNQGKEQPDFICDTAEIDLGSMALTALGIRAVDSIHVEE